MSFISLFPKQFKMKVITKSEATQYPARMTCNSDDAYPFMKEPFTIGQGKNTYVCGKCKRILLSHMGNDDVVNAKNYAYLCPKCQRYNALK